MGGLVQVAVHHCHLAAGRRQTLPQLKLDVVRLHDKRLVWIDRPGLGLSAGKLEQQAGDGFTKQADESTTQCRSTSNVRARFAWVGDDGVLAILQGMVRAEAPWSTLLVECS